MPKFSIARHTYTSSFILFLLFVLTSACEQHKNVKIDGSSPQFKMQQSNRLFFRNMRQTYYDMEEMKAAKMEVYRISERDTSHNAPVINAKIIQHWGQDRAYAMIDPHPFLEGIDVLKVSWADTTQNTKGTYTFPINSPQPIHYRFATELYSSIQSGHVLTLEVADQEVSLFPTHKSREPFRKTMVDFYRLVGIL